MLDMSLETVPSLTFKFFSVLQSIHYVYDKKKSKQIANLRNKRLSRFH